MGTKIVYAIGGLYSPNGTAQVLSSKANYLAKNTDYPIHVILTEKEEIFSFYKLSPLKKMVINFNLNFDELNTIMKK